jgi:Gpi18-like mannosyltransferase
MKNDNSITLTFSEEAVNYLFKAAHMEVINALTAVVVTLWHGTAKIIIKRLQAIRKLKTRVHACTKEKEMMLFLMFGLLVRFLLAPWTEQRFDNYVNRLWCSLVYRYNSYPFEPSMPLDYPLILRYSYPPVWFFVILSLFPVWLMIGEYNFPENPALLWKHGVDVSNLFESYRSFIPKTLPLLDLLFKLPNVAADIGIGYLLYRLAGSKYDRMILFLWFFNPYIVQISAVWGSFDPLCTFFTFYSVYLLWKKNPSLSALFLSLGVATKMYPLFFLIPVLIYIYKKQGLKESIKYLFIFFFSGIFIFSCFLIFPGGLEFIYRLFIFKASPDLYGRNLISGLTWTYVFMLFRWETNVPIFPLIFIPTYLWFNYIFWKRKETDFDSFVACLASILFTVYLSYTVVNPQYGFWVLPFLLYLITKEKFSKNTYITFTAILFVFIYGWYNPLYFISPIIIWEEWNYPPWSDIILGVWQRFFNVITLAFIVSLFCFVSFRSLMLLKRCIGEKCSG